MIALHYPPGATPLDPSELEGLKLPHITTQGELNRWEQDNISDAVSWTKRMRRAPSERGLSLYAACKDVWQGLAVGWDLSPVR